MFSSLHSRLLMTYVFLITVVLFVVGFALILFIFQNPIIDRQVFNRLEAVIDVVKNQGFRIPRSEDRFIAGIYRLDQQTNVRVLILSSDGKVIVDSRENEAAELNFNLREIESLERGFTLDSYSKPWYTVWVSLDDGYYLVLATRKVNPLSLLFTQRLKEFLQDDLVPPLIRSGFIALILALILSLLMANWISLPLRRISDATHYVTRREYTEVPEEGPKEVKQLAKSFNDMVRKVKSSQKSQKDFAANISHDLKTPLTSIQGFAQALLDGTIESDEKINEAANIILKEATRMHRMVVDLLELARLEVGTTQLEKSIIDLNILLSEVLEKVHIQAEKRKVKLYYENNISSRIEGDWDRLVQVFTNLIENAIKFSSPGGNVEVKGNNLNDYVLVEIIDTGIGIDQDEIDRIFDRFYQVDQSRSGDTRGIGLGLSIAKEIIYAHNGRIEVESELGEGSRFMVKIPVAKTQETLMSKSKRKRSS